MKIKYTFFFLLFLSQHLIFSQEQSISSAKISFTFVNEEVDGTLSGFTSSSSIDFNDLENSKFKGSVDVETIDTGNSLRNWSIRRGKYFNASDYPKISFESTSIQSTASGFTVKGDLTIKSITKSISVDFTKSGTQITGTTTLYSSDYGITISKKGREKNQVDVIFAFQLK